MEPRILVKMGLDCGRCGFLSGVFITTESARQGRRGRTIHFGEVLGKHSDVSWTFDDIDTTLEVVSTDQGFIAASDTIFEADGYGTLTGHNPFFHIHDDEDEEEAP